jgi:hypothetical protein
VIGFNVLTNLSIPTIVLIYGQLLQTIAPITIFYPVHRITNNYKAAMISVIVAGLGWNMPSLATSWGKYPALLSMVSAIFVYQVTWNYLRKKPKTAMRFISLVTITLTAILSHSRLFVLLIISILTKIPKGWKLVGKRQRILITILGLTIIIYMALDPTIRENWILALYPYTEVKILLVLLLVLFPLSVIYFTDCILDLVFFTTLTFIFSTIPAPQFLKSFNPDTLIDRPFLSIALFIPLSIIIGIGFAGLEKFTNEHSSLRSFYKLFLIVIITFVLFFPTQKVLLPQPSTNFVTSNDLTVYYNIKKFLPSNTKILIPNATPYYNLGIDAGAWIEYVTGHQTVKMPYDTDLTSLSTYMELCAIDVDYIYAGSTPYSYSSNKLEQRKQWYSPSIVFPDSKLYQVIGCS